MLFAAGALVGATVEASDGRAGAVRDFLVDDRWTVRCLVADPGERLPGQRLLIPRSALGPIRLPPRPAFPMLSFGETMAVPVALTREAIDAAAEATAGDAGRPGRHLGGAAALKGFSVHAADGEAGAIDAVFLDDARWNVRCLVVALPGWFGRRVQVQVAAVGRIDWPARAAILTLSRAGLEAAPAFDPLAVMAEDVGAVSEP